MRRLALAVPAVWPLLFPHLSPAQRGTGDWMTSANDAQRSAWVRGDAKISLDSMRKPGFALVWKMRMEDKPGNTTPLTPPALLDFYIGYRGFRTLGFFGAASNRLIAIDTDLGRLEWERTLAPPPSVRGTPECPGGMTSAVTRPANTSYPAIPTGRGAGRGTPAKSGVGEPHQGAVTIRPAAATPPPVKPPAAAKSKPAVEAPNPFAPRIQYVLAVSGDGKLHSMWLSNGNEATPAVPFLPPNANASGLIAFDNTAYVTTTNRCGGVDNGLWAIDLETKKVSHWKSDSRSIAGSAGPAVGPDGTLYVAGGTEIAALSPKTLELQAVYKTDGPEFTSSPVVFQFRGRDLIAATTGDGRLRVLDSAALPKPDGHANSETFSGRNFPAGALASWQDPVATRWVLAPASAGGKTDGFQTNGDVKQGAIVAWKVVEKDGTLGVQPGWISRNFVLPMSPIVVNGVVFALDGGAPGSANAVLYALDSATGRELWSSGTTMKSHATGGGLSAGGTRVYVATQDGVQYAFGFPIEH